MSQKQTLQDWLSFVESQHPETVIELGLGRMKRMLEVLNIRFDCPVILVGGTNGKGSTCAMLESIYRAAGLTTAVHTSPHMLRFNERGRINGKELADVALVEAFEEVDAKREGLGLTYFEFTALAILLAFQKANPDVVILEIGLGGRLDAINALEPTASIVTTIGVDHEAFLGNTRDSIGWEKAHIYRKGKPAVCADPNPPLKLFEVALTMGAKLTTRAKDFDVVVADGVLTFKNAKVNWTLPLPALEGVNQIDNAAGVLQVISELLDQLPVTEAQIAQGLREVKITARFQKVADEPLTYLDVGHNPHAAVVLAKNVAQLPKGGKTLAVFGMLADKDMHEVIALMQDQIDQWFIASLPPPRGASCELLKKTMLEAGVKDGKIKEFENIEMALVAAQQEADSKDKIIVFGSFVTVTATLNHFVH